jgi:hypothetical protein
MDIGLCVLILTAKVGENFRRQLKDLVLSKEVGSRGEKGRRTHIRENNAKNKTDF